MGFIRFVIDFVDRVLANYHALTYWTMRVYIQIKSCSQCCQVLKFVFICFPNFTPIASCIRFWFNIVCHMSVCANPFKPFIVKPVQREFPLP